MTILGIPVREYRVVPIDGIVPYADNARTHSSDQIQQIAASFREFGYTNPILIDEQNRLIAGHGRLEAARIVGMTHIPAIIVAGLSDEQRRALIIADNQLALNAGWDMGKLGKELADLKALKFDIDKIGFSKIQLADVFAQKPVPAGDDETIPELPVVASSRVTDVWILGDHRLMCGNSRDVADVQKLLAGKKPTFVYTDPPYGISIVNAENKVGGDKAFGKVGTIDRGMKAKPIVEANRYAPVAGDDSIDVAIDAIKIIKSLSAKVVIIWGGNYYAAHLENSSCWIVWDKDNGESFFADAELAWTNQKTAVRIFKHRWNGLIKASEHGQKRVHPTQKPIALAEWCLEKYGEKDDLVLDLFGGSGSTLIACEKVGRRCLMMELSPDYVDVIVRRWEAYTGKKATLEATGETFEQVFNNRKSAGGKQE